MKDQFRDKLKTNASGLKWILGICAKVLQHMLCERTGTELIPLQFWNMKTGVQITSEYLMGPGESYSTGPYFRFFPYLNLLPLKKGSKELLPKKGEKCSM